ncbi:hypothetical protein K505DRAFT_340982 [Melanomma pulvis-pyrius CBS 109.77]|uniref:Alpha-ketoglutarate-dependent sulfonate dioxygenase n=1 Tax=Melanomma pulvis-pyrius CBS 109.77 TaxID=1314802 RepID=A0A6A6X0U1_9PLEO|nr:hypothetical protein K505DRAFT_340982 [Melanomma pulvis-pyrius CBS 109.77]
MGDAKTAVSPRASLTKEEAALPPPYSSQPPSNQASSSNVEAGATPEVRPVLENLDFEPSPLQLPTAAECIVHLKLLHAFAKLRHDVGNQEGLFGIDLEKFERAEEETTPGGDSHQPDGVHEQNTAKATIPTHTLTEEEKEEAALAERIREKRWSVFVTKAVDRFQKWWGSLSAKANPSFLPLSTEDFKSANIGLNYNMPFQTQWSGLDEGFSSILPPLDVLMVWHSYLLNPRVYFEDCFRLSRHELWRTAFPWKAIHEAIDNETYVYTAPDEAIKTFASSPGISWNSADDDRCKAIACPKCLDRVLVPWTRPPVTTGPEAIEAYLSSDTGFAGQAFQEACPLCEFVITHEKLRVAKFISDSKALLMLKRPLPGTVFNSVGWPESAAANKDLGTHDPFFPNRMVEKLPEFHYTALRKEIENLSIEVLKSRIQRVITSSARTQIVNSDQYKPDLVAKDSKIAVRKMLAQYWDNSSPFGLDLVGAVLRQGTFVLKMRRIDWLHSPAAMTTMQRLIVKYHRFIRIIADNPKKIAVPTLDVDLAWHTHQLTPKIYSSYTLAECKKFLNHDDKIPETSLHTYFQWTSIQYEKKYGQPYSECACWYCECMREPLRSSFTNRINPLKSSKQYNIDVLAEKGLPKDPALGPHISSHNAISGQYGSDKAAWAYQRRREFEELDMQYAKVCKRYRKKKKDDDIPARENDAYIYGAYGYPMYYPMYVPYYAEPTNPVGGGGACAAGTCAASASLGACSGGAGTPGCAASCGGNGDAGGGCGSGGDGGGGGCGGGCGG